MRAPVLRSLFQLVLLATVLEPRDRLWRRGCTPPQAAARPGQSAFSSPPTANGGIVYTGGAGDGGTVYAVSESTGSVLWAQPVANGDHSSPALSGAGVYVSYTCGLVYAFDRLTGQQKGLGAGKGCWWSLPETS